MLYDTHVHTAFSADGMSRLEEYTGLLDEGRVKGIGFAEHVDFLPICGSYGYLDFPDYLKTVDGYRQKGYNFYAGAEIDYIKCVEGEILSHLDKYNYAYTICSVHTVDGMGVSDRIGLPAVKDRQRLSDILSGYYRELEWSIKAPAFDVIGHIGVFKRYLGKDFFEDEALTETVKEAECEMARLCAGSHKLVEVNSSGLFSPLGKPVPDADFLKEYYRLGGRNISTGSDAHCTRDVGRGLEQVHGFLKEIGFKYVILPWDRENPQSI